MVTLVDVDATWVNPATVDYNAAELRRADAAGFVTAGVVRATSSALSVSVDGSDVVTVKAGSWVIPGNAVSGSGVWRGGIASDVTGSLSARDATNGRIDLVVARQLDTDVVGTHGAYTGRIEIIAGTPSATPGVPALPSMAVELGRITVPVSGGGAASVDMSHRTYATAPGGEAVVPSLSLLPTTLAAGALGYALDTGIQYRFDGTTWGLAAGTPDSWHTIGDVGEPALKNGWTQDAITKVRFRKDSAERVSAHGFLTNFKNGLVAFTFPVGYRPPRDMGHFPQYGPGATPEPWVGVNYFANGDVMFWLDAASGATGVHVNFSFDTAT